MAIPLLSTSWYRVADRRPKLRSHARMHRHRYRGELWYLLQDPASSRVHRFTPAARLLISLMDGTRTVARLWEIANRRLGENAPTQDEMIQLLGQLHAADLLQSDVTPDVAELFSRGAREDRARHRRSYANPMALRIPLWDPDAFLNRTKDWISRIWSGWGAILWLAVVLPAVFLVPAHWPELTNNFTDRVLALDNLVVLYLAFPALKALHELGHATATKAGGGEVHDIRYSDIAMKNVRRPFDINMLYNGNAGLVTDVGPRQAEPGQTQYIPNFHDIHVANLTITRSPLAGRIIGLPEQLANDITFTNVKAQSTRGFLVQDAKDIVFRDSHFDIAIGEPLVLDNGSVNWNGKQKSGSSGGPPEPFY